MNVKTILLLVSCLSLLLVSVAFAKRAAPAIVAPVKVGGIEYRAPHGQMGCVEAWDVEQGELIWRRQVYVVKYAVGLERDVQDVFIRSMEIKDNSLIVKNERQSEYRLDLDSLEVEIVQGSLVEAIQ